MGSFGRGLTFYQYSVLQPKEEVDLSIYVGLFAQTLLDLYLFHLGALTDYLFHILISSHSLLAYQIQ